MAKIMVEERVETLRGTVRNSTEIGSKLYEKRGDPRRVMNQMFVISYKQYL